MDFAWLDLTWLEEGLERTGTCLEEKEEPKKWETQIRFYTVGKKTVQLSGGDGICLVG